jgi:predicted Rossmann-fold nucleotide-binding protein
VGRDYWQGLIEWLRRQLLKNARISPTDMDIIQVLDDPQEIVATVRKILVI